MLAGKNILVLANERRLRRDKHLEEFQGHAPTENFVFYRFSKMAFPVMCGNIVDNSEDYVLIIHSKLIKRSLMGDNAVHNVIATSVSRRLMTNLPHC